MGQSLNGSQKAEVPGDSKEIYAFGCCGIKSMWLIFKTKVSIYQSKANLDVKILFSSITHRMDPED